MRESGPGPAHGGGELSGRPPERAGRRARRPFRLRCCRRSSGSPSREPSPPQDLLDRTRHLPEDQVVQQLVGKAYRLLDTSAQQVMQAPAVYPAPVSAVGIDFLLRPVNPTTDAAPILTRLVRRQLARFQDGRYYLHPVNRDYARSQLRPGSPGDSPAAFTLTGLRACAADYLGQQGNYASALEPQKQHLDSLEQAFGLEDPGTLTARVSLADLTGQAGDEARAIRRLAGARHAPADWTERARIIALSWDGLGVPAIADRVGCHENTAPA